MDVCFDLSIRARVRVDDTVVFCICVHDSIAYGRLPSTASVVDGIIACWMLLSVASVGGFSRNVWRWLTGTATVHGSNVP